MEPINFTLIYILSNGRAGCCIRQGVMGNVRPKEDKGGMAGRIGPDQHGPSSPSVIRVDPGLCIRA